MNGEKEAKTMVSQEMLESISDDLFRIKIELGLLRIDDLDDFYDDRKNFNHLKTQYQRMFFCKRNLKRYIFWYKFDLKQAEEHIERLCRADECQDEDKKELLDFSKIQEV